MSSPPTPTKSGPQIIPLSVRGGRVDHCAGDRISFWYLEGTDCRLQVGPDDWIRLQRWRTHGRWDTLLDARGVVDVRTWTQNAGWLDWRLCPGALVGERGGGR